MARIVKEPMLRKIEQERKEGMAENFAPSYEWIVDKKVPDLVETIRVLRAALAIYGDHLPKCPAGRKVEKPGRCRCGWTGDAKHLGAV